MAITEKQREAIKKYRQSEKGKNRTNQYEKERRRIQRLDPEFVLKEKLYASKMREMKKQAHQGVSENSE